MGKIDTSSWGGFSIGKLFNVYRPVARKQSDYVEGTYPFVASGCFNNGVQAMLQPKNATDIDEGNCITVSPVDGYAFYQEDSFLGRGGAGSSIIILRNDKISRYSGQYVASVLRHTFKNWNYSNMGNKDIVKKEIVKLPIDSKGEPDWLYMENYMRNIEVRVSTSISKLESAQRVENRKIDVSSWGDFLISDVFETNKKGKSIQVPTGANVKKADLEYGSIPRITVTGVNNGIYGYYADIPNDNNYRVYGNFISVSFLGTVFYQKGKASLDMKVHYLRPIKHTLNEYTGGFLITAILASLKESSYSDQISSTVLPTLTIKLPIDSKGEPDWLYMENYMKALETRVNDFLNKTA